MSNKVAQDLYDLAEAIAPGLSIQEYDRVVKKAMVNLDSKKLTKRSSASYESNLIGKILDAMDSEPFMQKTSSKQLESITVQNEEDLDWTKIAEALNADMDIQTDDIRGEKWNESSKTYVPNGYLEEDMGEVDMKWDPLKETYDREDIGDAFDIVNDNLTPSRSKNDFSTQS